LTLTGSLPKLSTNSVSPGGQPFQKGVNKIDFLAVIIGGLLGLVLLYFISVYPLRLRYKSKLKRMSTEELQAEAYEYPKDYFLFLGEGNKSVQEYKDLVEKKDLEALIKNRRRLSRSFRRLEIATGYYGGRSGFMEYYDGKKLVLQELRRRKSKTAKA